MLNKLFKRIRSTVFPNRCIVCGNICVDEFFCTKCNGTLEPFKVKLCTKCGAPKWFCQCKYYFYYFDKIVTAFPNKDTAKEAFYRFKFNSAVLSAGYFADCMADKVKNYFNNTDFDYITYIPMHFSKKSDRGYNQSEILAKHISKKLKIPFKKVLIQPKKSKVQQKDSTIAERFLNIKGRYKVKSNIDIKGKHILLVDDIMTTGSTLSEAARELKLMGAEYICCVAALKTLNKRKKLRLKPNKPIAISYKVM